MKINLFSGKCQQSSFPNQQISENGTVPILRWKGGETIQADLTERATGWQNDNSPLTEANLAGTLTHSPEYRNSSFCEMLG